MKKVLVIEDDNLVRTGLVTALRRHGYEVLDASRGTAGVQLAFSQRPHIVLSDVNLPDQNGIDVLRELRARPETAAIPVILMTGEPHKADARYSMNCGADDYLQKPFTMEQVLATLNARLDRQDGIQRALEAQTRAERISAADKIRLQTTALEAAANGIVITDAQGRILWTNQAFTRLTGYSADEVHGQNPRFLNSARQPREFFARLWATINAGEVWQGELINQRKDGSCYHEEMTITPVRGESGEIQNFVAIKQDITARKQNEQALNHKRDLLQALMDNLPDHIYFKDLNSRFTRVNQAHARHLGLNLPEDAIGKCDADFFPLRQARQKLVDERRLLATGEPVLGLVEPSDTPAGHKWVSTTKVPVYGSDGRINGLVGISRDITSIKQTEEQLRRNEADLAEGQRVAKLGTWQFDIPANAVRWSEELYRIFGIDRASFQGGHADFLNCVVPEDRAAVLQANAEARAGGKPFEIEYRIHTPAGDVKTIRETGYATKDGSGRVVSLFGTAQDVTERKRLETELLHARKLESIGQLAAGIAHEINTPTQYVGDNTRFVKDSFAAVTRVLDSHQALLAAAQSGGVTPELLARCREIMAAADLEYVRTQIPQALEETLEGVGRVAMIVRAMKEFSHPGGKERTSENLNQAVESTVTVARNEWKYVADLKLELDPALPRVPCYLGEINQAVLNLLVNAAHSIGDVIRKTPGARGLITVRTGRCGNQVQIRVTDTGTGIPEAVRPRIFEPFFTTKDVGRGTGQGLAMVYSSVVKHHGGTVTFETETGCGTTFIISLPLESRIATGATGSPPAERLKA